MTISHVGSSGQVNSTTDGSGNLTAVYGQTPTGGNLLVLRCDANAAFTAAPTGWTAAGTFPIDFTAVGLYYRVATGTDPAPVIVSAAGAAVVGQIDEYSSSIGWNATPLDGYNGTNTNALSVPTGLTGTTAQAEELACAVFGAPGVANPTGFAANGTITPSSAYAQIGTTINVGGTCALVCADGILGATGTTGCTGTWNSGGISDASAIIATFKTGTGPIKAKPTLIAPSAAAHRAASW